MVHRYTAHGSFGDTLTVKGIAIRVVPAEPDLARATICRTDDPERQGWTEVLTYEITATWPDPSDADDPMFEVGAHPWFVTLYDPPVTSGVPSRVTTCHRPGDSMVVHVGLSGGQDANEILIEYEWYFG